MLQIQEKAFLLMHKKKTPCYQKISSACFYTLIWSSYLKNNPVQLFTLILFGYFVYLFLQSSMLEIIEPLNFYFIL